MSSHHGCLQNPGQNPSPRGSPFPFAFRSVFRLPSVTAKTRNRGSPEPACGPTACGGTRTLGKTPGHGNIAQDAPCVSVAFSIRQKCPIGWNGKYPMLGGSQPRRQQEGAFGTPRRVLGYGWSSPVPARSRGAPSRHSFGVASSVPPE